MNGAHHAAIEREPAAVRLALVPVVQSVAVLELVQGWIAAAFTRGVAVDRPMERIRGELASGKLRLMVGALGEEVIAAAVLEVMQEDKRNYLFVVAAGGVVGETFDSCVGPAIWRGIVDLAREWKLEGVRLVGRPGWARWCQRHGGGARVTVKQILLECEV